MLLLSSNLVENKGLLFSGCLVEGNGLLLSGWLVDGSELLNPPDFVIAAGDDTARQLLCCRDDGDSSPKHWADDRDEDGGYILLRSFNFLPQRLPVKTCGVSHSLTVLPL